MTNEAIAATVTRTLAHLSLLLAALYPSLGVTQPAVDWEKCQSCSAPAQQRIGTDEDRIASCTRLIRFGQPSAISVLAEAYYYRGICWYRKGDNGPAILDFNEALRLNPSGPGVYYARALARWVIDNNGAIADFGEAIRLNPKFVEAYSGRAIAWGISGELDKAILDLDQALVLDPKRPAVYKDRGDVWRQKGDFERAIADYNEAIRLDPRYADAYLHRSFAWAKKGDKERADADYGEAIRLDPRLAQRQK